MRNLVSLAALVAVVALVSTLRAEETPWHKVASKAGGVAAMFPGVPQTKAAPAGEQILLEADGGATVYLMQWTKLPAKLDVEDAEAVKALFDNAQASALKALAGSKVLSSEDDDFGIPGRELQLEAPGIGIYRTRLLLDGEKLYQVTIAGKKEITESDDAAAFFHSFRVVE
jgi:hypothetical protein